jgi:CBS domain-containing protein
MHEHSLREPAADLGAALIDTPVALLLRTDPDCVAPELSVEFATALFLERGLAIAPVLDDDGRLIGSLSRDDLLQAWHQRRGRACDPLATARVTVADIMRPAEGCLPSSAPMLAALRLMARGDVPQIFVIAPSRRLVGTVGWRDVARWVFTHCSPAGHGAVALAG